MNSLLPSLSFLTYFCSGKCIIKSKPTWEFITALIQATQSNCLKASVKELNPFSASACRASKMAESPPCSRNPSIHFWSALRSLFFRPEKLRPLFKRVTHSSGSAPSRFVASNVLELSRLTNFFCAFFHIPFCMISLCCRFLIVSGSENMQRMQKNNSRYRI